jgi:tRNA (guanine-N7-)-methyltransferase
LGKNCIENTYCISKGACSLENLIQDKLWKIAQKIPFPSPYFIQIHKDNPISIQTEFPSYTNHFLEIGSGWGEVAIELAIQNPSTLYILMEKKIERINI